MCWFSLRHSCAPEDCSLVPTKPHASRRQRALPLPRHPRQPNNGLVCCCVQRTAYSACIALPCIVNGDDSAVFHFFCFLVTLTFELGRDFRTTYLIAKFDLCCISTDFIKCFHTRHHLTGIHVILHSVSSSHSQYGSLPIDNNSYQVLSDSNNSVLL